MSAPPDEIRESFDRQSKDPQAYLELARTLAIAATPVLDHFRETITISQTVGDTRLKMLAYSNAYMLLTGLAFENLLKAIALSRGWTILRLKNATKGGHALVAIADILLLELAPEEQEYLRRLEEYVVWAGRYPVPLTSDRYAASEREELLVYRSTDPGVGRRLFAKLEPHVGQSSPTG